jgi:hypothetical protein
MTSFRLWALALALTCWIAGPAQAGAYEDLAKPYIQKLAVTGEERQRAARDESQPALHHHRSHGLVRRRAGGRVGLLVVLGHAAKPRGRRLPRPLHRRRGRRLRHRDASRSPTEASTSHVIGGEIAVVSRNPNSANAVKWGMPLIFFNRFGGTSVPVEAGLGDNSLQRGVEGAHRSRRCRARAWASFRAGRPASSSTAPRSTARSRCRTPPRSIRGGRRDAPGVPWYILTWKCGVLEVRPRHRRRAPRGVDRDRLSPFPRRLRIL